VSAVSLRPLLLALAATLPLSTVLPAAGEANIQDPVPMLAYYYIWFEPASWERAKTDYPLLGRYGSDDAAVMLEHVRSAQAAGIDGFIVSWKSTSALDRRLEQLMEVAAQANFKLWIIYQGLDFERRPLPVARIDHDLETFVARYAEHAAFAMYDRPVVIWSGTWEFERAEIAEISSSYRKDLYLLASERNVAGYRRIADLVDGNAYYWSSVNPETYPDYPGKLRDFSEAVHRRGGLWVAPAAPGFDARLLGGKTVVGRRGGQTLQVELDAALRSSPDAIGLISWNEFSENTHIEPSERRRRSPSHSSSTRAPPARPTSGAFTASRCWRARWPSSGPTSFTCSGATGRVRPGNAPRETDMGDSYG
jgi:hypothetical protein